MQNGTHCTHSSTDDAGTNLCLVDVDHDGYGTVSPLGECEDVPHGDCDDSAASVHPHALDACNHVDDDCDGTIDEGTPETCNAVDDDCDGMTDEGTAVAYFTDLDGDGSGTGDPITACVQPPATALTGGDCDDAAPGVNPDTQEICDGLDNDCSDAADDSFECVMNTATPCRTTCGSTGSGTCSSSCTTPTILTCTPPQETCNLADDDCDGVADQGLVRALPGTTWWAYDVPKNVGGAISLPRRGGGAWLFLDNTRYSSGIFVESLDSAGNPAGSVAAAAVKMAGGRYFRATTTDKHIVVASTLAASALALRIQVFDLETFAFIDEYTLADATGIAVAAKTDAAGTLRVMLAHYKSSPSGSYVGWLTRTPEGSWTYANETLVASRFLFTTNIAIESVPCLDRWLMVLGNSTTDADDGYMAHWDLAGSNQTNITSTTLELSSIGGIGTMKTDCKSDPEMLVGTVGTGASQVAFLRVLRNANSIAIVRDNVGLPGRFAALSFANHGARWFLAGVSFPAEGEATRTLFAELDGTSSNVLLFDLLGDVDPGGYLPDLLVSRVGVTFTGTRFAVTFSDGSVGNANADAQYHKLFPAETKQPLGMTYLVGCP